MNLFTHQFIIASKDASNFVNQSDYSSFAFSARQKSLGCYYLSRHSLLEQAFIEAGYCISGKEIATNNY
jgi:hypothetical protein